MIVTVEGITFDLLGDPHLGRQFVNGVSLNRRGEREAMVWQDFEKSLVNTTSDFHVCMGDLFDKWIVPYDTILRAADVYMRAADDKPDTIFVIMKGNHDWIRDLERRSAFDVFAAVVESVDNIWVISIPTVSNGVLFYPWHPSKDAGETVARYKNIKAAFGHWDTEFGEHNMVPTKAGIPVLYTGHVHKPTSFTRDGTEVVVVGSMQPYAFGEETDDSLYVTLDKPEGDLRNKVVRLKAPPTEPVDCLQLVLMRESSRVVDNSPTVSLGNFDLEGLFRRAFQEAEVPPSLVDEVLGQFQARRVANNA